MNIAYYLKEFTVPLLCVFIIFAFFWQLWFPAGDHKIS